MITNDVQYRTTRARLRQFEEALVNLEAASRGGTRTRLSQLEIDAVASQRDDLAAEIVEYERLRSGKVTRFEAASLSEVATLLVMARIARGWTQRRLAEALGMAEQQVQRYEASGYASASLARLCEVADALDVEVVETAQLRDPDAA